MTWPLPDAAHVPGLTRRPEISPAFEAATAAPPRTDPELWAGNATYLYGARLYAEGFFWEAHEVWEAVWMGTAPNSRERALLAGLIQLANGCLKLAMSRPNAAVRLFAMSAERLDAAGGALMGLDPGMLAAETRRFAGRPGGPALSDRPALHDPVTERALAPPGALD